MRRGMWWFVIFGLAIAAAWAAAEDLDGPAIVKKMGKQNESTSLVSKAKMTIGDASGKERVRELIMRSKMVNDLRHSVTTFLSPPDVRGVKFLVIENKNGDDDQRIYLPELKRVRRITSSNKSGSFMGSAFSYADLQTPNADKGKHKRLADQQMGGFDCYTVESTSKNPDDYVYGKFIYWVRKDNFMPVRADFYDKKNAPLKVLEISDFQQRPDGTWFAKRTKMTNVQDKTSTTLEVSDYQVGAAIDDEFFSDRFLSDENRE